jgi:hypothetical protein
MSRLNQIYKLAEQHKLPVSTVFKDYILTPRKRYEIIAKMEDPDMEPEDLDQMCETPPSQKKLLSFF